MYSSLVYNITEVLRCIYRILSFLFFLWREQHLAPRHFKDDGESLGRRILAGTAKLHGRSRWYRDPAALWKDTGARGTSASASRTGSDGGGQGGTSVLNLTRRLRCLVKSLA